MIPSRRLGSLLFVGLIAFCALSARAEAPSALPRATIAGLRYYDSIGILKPAGDATIFDNAGNLEVLVAVAPALRPGDRVVLTLDGHPAASGAGLRFALSGIDRGEHTLVAKAVDSDGDSLIASPPVVFNLWRASRLFPNRRGG